ncbi:unnamed protein product [Rhizophagus irregularis]|uniref:Uncharacterized protein n=1 Tax=Rhizophagus irregularis TaxID=588596 RepID=A0A916EEX4_9GLOM|nr:unnamed protein product [Rhizophagus irregularis]CAB5216946.1 unnamed protein product [Rhizophagus irregularis]CAB5377221.1 unnamed protein product [Rhizophagus irregularis]
MGKPSLNSRKSSRNRKKNRRERMLKELKGKDEEVADLQVQLLDFKKVVYDSGEKLLNKLEKSSRENNNLVEWLKIYDEKIKDYEKEIYDLNLRLYFSQQHQQTQPQQQSQQQSQSPTFSSLSEYFKFHKS